jgi:hypothetical protein
MFRVTTEAKCREPLRDRINGAVLIVLAAWLAF